VSTGNGQAPGGWRWVFSRGVAPVLISATCRDDARAAVPGGLVGYVCPNRVTCWGPVIALARRELIWARAPRDLGRVGSRRVGLRGRFESSILAATVESNQAAYQVNTLRAVHRVASWISAAGRCGGADACCCRRRSNPADAGARRVWAKGLSSRQLECPVFVAR